MTTVDWDYTALAASYSQRPNYADAAIDHLVAAAGLAAGDAVLDLGAGTGHLTLKLAARGLLVTALEPNAAMRAIGQQRTAGLPGVRWHEALMQQTGLPAGAWRLTAYGSSLGVAPHDPTLREAQRLLQTGGHLAALFNHRELDDPLQQEIEALIRRAVPGYRYGNRREDQAPLIAGSGCFVDVQPFEVPFVHEQPRAEWVQAWWSHATLARQAGERFAAIVEDIAALVAERCPQTVRVPYITRGWVARRV